MKRSPEKPKPRNTSISTMLTEQEMRILLAIVEEKKITASSYIRLAVLEKIQRESSKN